MGFSDYQVNQWLNELKSCWLSLHYDNPDVAGAYASEVFAGSYTRQAVFIGAANNRTAFVVSDAVFTGLPATRITHVGGWDQQYNGNILFTAALSAPIVAIVGASKTFPAGTIALSMS